MGNPKTSDPSAIDFTDLGINGAGIIDPEELEAEKLTAERSERLVGQWKLRTLADAYRERPPLEFLVDGLLPCPSLSVVYGGPGSLKSMLLADLATTVVAGAKWLEPLPSSDQEPGVTFITVQAAVLWIDFDNGIRRTDERIEAFARARQLPTDAPLHYVSMPRPWLDASKPSLVAELAELIRELGAKLIIIDNLGLITGDTEENSGEMAQVMGNLRWLCEETESAVIVVHHQRKSSGANDKGIRKGEMLRGHSSIEAALDLALLVERKEGEDAVAVIPTKVRGFKEYNIFGAHFTYDHRPGTKDLSLGRFYSLAVSSKEEREIEAIQATIKATLRGTTMSQRDLVNSVRDSLAAMPGGTAPGISKVRGILKKMVEAKDVIEDGNGGGRLYRLI
jgi:archaellum biogenesis ATPase FlaH